MPENAEPAVVVVLGASANPERYSYRAVEQLKAHGYRVIPVNPKYGEILGLPTVPTLAAVEGPVHTVTVYVRPEISSRSEEDLLRLRPGRVIFNVPGAENPELEARLRRAGIAVEEACTLVLLASGQF